jgi:pilus assembly protein CpaC
VELREGQTLAIAGLLDREMDTVTARIPVLGDLPFIGFLFGSTSNEVIEQELIVAVTPYLVSAIECEQRMPLPGAEILEPDDVELYLLNRIEGRTGFPHRATGQWDNPFTHQQQMQLEDRYFIGDVGFTD